MKVIGTKLNYDTKKIIEISGNSIVEIYIISVFKDNIFCVNFERTFDLVNYVVT